MQQQKSSRQKRNKTKVVNTVKYILIFMQKYARHTIRMCVWSKSVIIYCNPINVIGRYFIYCMSFRLFCSRSNVYKFIILMHIEGDMLKKQTKRKRSTACPFFCCVILFINLKSIKSLLLFTARSIFCCCKASNNIS